MARPRVFVSSTFYDLQHVRADLESFIKSFGFEPVMFEKGAIPWREDKSREEQCYAEVSRCDIVVSIIGGAFGTESQLHPGSISHNEMRRAVTDGKQVYAFIVSDVDAKHDVYKLNKGKKVDVEYGIDTRVLAFIDEVRAIASLGIQRFATAADITGHLREQWAGLFHELLSTREQVRQQAMMNKITELAASMEKALAAYGDLGRFVWGFSHPGIHQLRELLHINHHVFFVSLRQCDAFLQSLGYERLPPEQTRDGYIQWIGNGNELSIQTATVFTDKGLVAVPPSQWNREWITLEPVTYHANGDDDIPF